MGKQFDFHPLADLLPMPSEEDIAELAADIKAAKQAEAIVILDRKILDGRGRYQACALAGVEPQFRNYQRSTDGNDPAAFVITRNIMRRHLTVSQRALALAELRQKQPRGRPPEKMVTQDTISLGGIAEEAGLSTRTLKRADKVVARAAAVVKEAVKDGEVTIADAAAVADLPKTKQVEALKKVEAGEAKSLKAAARPKSGKQRNDPRGFAEWEDCFGKLKRMTDVLNKVAPAEKFCRQAQKQLNEVYETIKEWRTALR